VPGNLGAGLTAPIEVDDEIAGALEGPFAANI
jgi:hypothetical protein